MGDAKPGEAPTGSPDGQPNPQPSDIEARITALVETRVRGLQSVFDRRLDEMMRVMAQPPADDDGSGEPGKPLSRQSTSERALRLREDAVARRELELSKSSLALEFGIEPGLIEGSNPIELRLSAMGQAIKGKGKAPPVDEKKPPTSPPTNPPLGYNPVTGSSNPPLTGSPTSVEAMLQEGVRKHIETLKPK